MECYRQPLSGALKGRFSGDLVVKINGVERRIESKKRKDLNSYYERCVAGKITYIDGYYYIMGQEEFHGLLLGQNYEITIIEHKGIKFLEEAFNQDNSDIVALKSNYSPYLFAITRELFEELKGGIV